MLVPLIPFPLVLLPGVHYKWEESINWGYWASEVVLVKKNPPTNLGDIRDTRRPKRPRFDPWVRKIPWRAWQPTPVFLPGESHGQRSLAGYSQLGHKELEMTEET